MQLDKTSEAYVEEIRFTQSIGWFYVAKFDDFLFWLIDFTSIWLAKQYVFDGML